MRTNRTIFIATLLLAFATITGCGGADVDQHVTSVSQGQQLDDLKKALDQGAINEDEYQKLQKKILSRGY
ncbi:MAG TPA: SHOCT domain-containing protein [Pseudomonadales bacterium]|nr:SHOCT domain-containing protein [Pseudomonadales bacterium]